MNFKILGVIFATIFFVSIIFAFAMDAYIHVYDPNWRGILNNHGNINTKKIFIIGSSSEYAINSTKINEFFLKNDINYEVYNLADMSDNPKKRLLSLDNIISNGPVIVVYGIGLTEFQKQQQDNNSYEKIINYILNPHDFFYHVFMELSGNSFEQQFPTSPRDRTLTFLKYLIRGPDYIYHPFIHFKETPINDYETIKKNYQATEYYVDDSQTNEQILALNKLISQLKQNGIKVVLFSNPHHKIIIDKISESEMVKYTEMLKKVANEHEVDIFFIHENYVDLNIWRDPYHIAINPKANIFTDEIQKIILSEIEE